MGLSYRPARLHRLVGWCYNPFPTRFLDPIDIILTLFLFVVLEISRQIQMWHPKTSYLTILIVFYCVGVLNLHSEQADSKRKAIVTIFSPLHPFPFELGVDSWLGADYERRWAIVSSGIGLHTPHHVFLEYSLWRTTRQKLEVQKAQTRHECAVSASLWFLQQVSWPYTSVKSKAKGINSL
jgi:hypothetical protein